MATPAQVEIWIGLDVGKEFHHAVVLDDAGATLFDRRITNGEAELITVLDTATSHGVAALVIDQPGSIAQLALALARAREVPVAYIPGLVMRRAADLYPGDAKTDRRCRARFTGSASTTTSLCSSVSSTASTSISPRTPTVTPTACGTP